MKKISAAVAVGRAFDIEGRHAEHLKRAMSFDLKLSKNDNTVC